MFTIQSLLMRMGKKILDKTLSKILKKVAKILSKMRQ